MASFHIARGVAVVSERDPGSQWFAWCTAGNLNCGICSEILEVKTASETKTDLATTGTILSRFTQLTARGRWMAIGYDDLWCVISPWCTVKLVWKWQQYYGCIYE